MRIATPLFVASLTACGGDPGALPHGSWILTGNGVAGELVVENERTTVEIWGANWGTDGVARARPSQDEAGATWLAFPVQTAAGTAEASIQLDLDQGKAILPLGYREGELLHALVLKPGSLDEATRTAASRPFLDTRAALQQAWAIGAFTIRDPGGTLTGAVQLLPGNDAQVELIMDHVLTDGVVPARRNAEGADMLLHFEVEPRFGEELALLRFNVPVMRAVLPMDRLPHPDDRWFEVKPGRPEDAEIEDRLAAVRRKALEEERAMLGRLGPQLAGHAQDGRVALGRCPKPEEFDPKWQVLLGDYRMSVEDVAGECIVSLEPSMVQHTRRTATRATPLGLQNIEVLGGP